VKKLTAILFLCNIIIFSFVSYGQDNSTGDFNNTIKNLSSDAAQGYVGPVIGSFGSNLNTGWVTKAPSPTQFSFTLELKVIAMGSVLNDDQRTFSTTGLFRFTDSQAEQLLDSYSGSYSSNDRDALKSQILNTEFNVGISGPTIVGSEDERVNVSFPGQTFTVNGNDYTIPAQNIELSDVKGFLNNISLFPTATIQLGIGTFLGTNFAIRWFPKVNIKDLGDFTYWGFGAVHNPAVWFDEQFPVDIAVGYFYQDLKVGTIFETKANMFGIYASKTFGSIIAFTPYFGLTTESSTTIINYDYTYTDGNGVEQSSNVNFELDGTNSAGFTVGAAFKLAILNLNIDYKFANVKTASAGLTFGF